MQYPWNKTSRKISSKKFSKMKTRVIGNKTSEKFFHENRKYFSTKSRNIYGDFLQTILLIHNHNVILFLCFIMSTYSYVSIQQVWDVFKILFVDNKII